MDASFIVRNNVGYSAAVKAIRLSMLLLIGGTAIEAQSRANDLAAILAKLLETPES